MVDALQTRINALTADFVNRDDPAQRAVIERDRQKNIAELNRLKQTIQDDKKALAVKKLYGDVCHTYPSPRKTGEATARRITEHLVELGIRQAVQTVGLVEQKHAARYSHRLSRSHIKSGNCSRGNSSLSERPCPGILSISPNFSKLRII